MTTTIGPIYIYVYINYRTNSMSYFRFKVRYNPAVSKSPSESDENEDSLLPETVRLFDRIVQLLDQLIVALVRWQVETVEAGVRTGQPRVLAHLFDAETLGTVRAHQFTESAYRYPTRSGDEL